MFGRDRLAIALSMTLACAAQLAPAASVACAQLRLPPVEPQPVRPDLPHAKSLAEPPSEDTTSLAASFGGTLNTGNTRTWQLITGSDLAIARMPHEVGGNVVFAYGQADLPDDQRDKFETTVKSLRTRARYDYFLAQMDALFTAAAFRWDPFAGLNARAQGELGYLRYAYKTENHRVWTEIGYDFTYDDYHALPDAPPRSLPPNQITHSARVFFGYDNRLTEVLSYLGGIEGLLNLERARDTRVNMDNALRSHVGGNFALELKFSLQFDNIPVPGARKLDTQTIASLIYTLI